MKGLYEQVGNHLYFLDKTKNKWEHGFCVSCGGRHGACLVDGEGNCEYTLQKIEDDYWKTVRRLFYAKRKNETNQHS